MGMMWRAEIYEWVVLVIPTDPQPNSARLFFVGPYNIIVACCQGVLSA